MNNQIIPEVEFHKHLGLFFTGSLTWAKHIDYIKSKAWQRINILRTLKFKLDRHSLETIYISFIRPLLEYGDIIFDNCSHTEKEELEKINYEAARIVTGATKLVSIEKLFIEVGWEHLSKRRLKHKLITFYKMLHGLAPQYLCDLVPNNVGSTTSYNLRNNDHIQSVHSRTRLYQYSFLPSVVREWNSLPISTRQITSLSLFKHSLYMHTSIPKHFYYGERRLQVFLTRLRTNCSSLNHDLYTKNMSDSPLCDCGLIENAKHYFLECNSFTAIRMHLIQSLNLLSHVSISIILNGDPNLSYKENTEIVDAVHLYIKQSHRFER
jgi:hypothetical protein